MSGFYGRDTQLDPDGELDIRNGELQTLKAIYGNSLSIDFPGLSGTAIVPIKILNGIRVTLESESSGTVIRSTIVENLPPLELSFQLPPEYPYDGPLTFNLRCKVVKAPKLENLQTLLAQQWEDIKDQVLFSMIDVLQEAANQDAHELVGSEIQCGANPELFEEIVTFDREQKQADFDESTFTCDICQRDLKGAQCLRFEPCEHTFCNSCLHDFFTSLITRGDVEKVHCPDFECSKHFLQLREKYLRLEMVNSTSVNFEELKTQLMTPPIKLSLLQKLLAGNVDLYRKFLELFSDHQYSLIAKMFPTRLVSCPRRKCPAMIFRDNTTSRLVICRTCGYAFCNTCRKSHHSDSIDCSKKNNNSLYSGIPVEALEKWLDSAKGSRERDELRHRYGFDLMTKVSDEYLMDKLFSEMLADESQGLRKCPTCDLIIQRLDGCNKMKCSSCFTFFCNVCGIFLDPDKPYDHFRLPESSCYGKLFEGMPGADFD